MVARTASTLFPGGAIDDLCTVLVFKKSTSGELLGVQTIISIYNNSMSAAQSSSVAGAAASTSTTCHALPCNIDYTGKAPVEVYFRPAPVLVQGESGDDEAQQPPKYQAATLRGRGLLASAVNNSVGGSSAGSSCQIQGCVLAKDDSGQQLKTVTHFETLTEWHHEHSPVALAQKESRLRTAVDWLETAAALHAPIPVPFKTE